MNDDGNARKRNQGSDERRRQEQLGGQLRKLYDDVASEPVPDEFLKLLKDIDRMDDDNGDASKDNGS